MAHVQPQTQCTIAGAAREERAEGNKIRKRKKALGIQMQTTASITDTGTRGNISSDEWVTGITWALLRTHAVLLGGLCSEYSGPLPVFPEVMSSFIGILSVKQLNIMMLWCHGDIVSQTLLYSPVAFLRAWANAQEPRSPKRSDPINRILSV